MSASAGKVMPRPMGDYNALTEYKVLDIVTYNDRPYMAKQTTTGNTPIEHPTAQNPDSYWMLLLDFPTEVDNAPTQNSPNLVTSGGVYSSLAAKMGIDGSGAENLNIEDPDREDYGWRVNSVTKSSGLSQDVTIVEIDNGESNVAGFRNDAFFKAHIGNNKVYYINNDTPVFIEIDSVSTSGGTTTVTAHLVEDSEDAISLTNVDLYFKNYIDSDYTDNVVKGVGCAVNGDGYAEGVWSTVANKRAHAEGKSSATEFAAHAEGADTIANGSFAHAEGSKTVASGIGAHAEGTNTRAHGNFSHAAGSGNRAGYANQTVVGKYNDNKSATLFEVGKGSSDSNRSNAFEVYSDGTFSQNDGTDKYKFAKSGGIDGFYDGSNDFHPFYKELVNNSVVLSTSADTTVTFSDASITADSTIEPFTSVYSIAPKDCVASAGQCVVTIPKQSSAQTIKVKIRVS